MGRGKDIGKIKSYIITEYRTVHVFYRKIKNKINKVFNKIIPENLKE